MNLRSADLTTLIRVLVAIGAAYLVIIKYQFAILIVIALAVAYILDAVDGYLATREASKAKIGLLTYLKYSFGDKRSAKAVSNYKHVATKLAPSGARIDVAGDRIVEYLFLLVFLYLHVIPYLLPIVVLIVIMHSITDALMGARGTSMKTKSALGRIFYTSNASRWFSGFIKFVTFSYLALVYVLDYPIWIGSLLICVLFAFIIIRGFAQINESIR